MSDQTAQCQEFCPRLRRLASKAMLSGPGLAARAPAPCSESDGRRRDRVRMRELLGWGVGSGEWGVGEEGIGDQKVVSGTQRVGSRDCCL